jgi:Ca2+:H+ antiporter
MDRHAVWRISAEVWHTTKATLLCSYSNELIFCVPLGIIAAERRWSPAAVFAITFLVMLPLASILTFSTEELAAKVVHHRRIDQCNFR